MTKQTRGDSNKEKHPERTRKERDPMWIIPFWMIVDNQNIYQCYSL